MEEMKELIENYQTHINQIEKLRKRLKKLRDYNTKITASYGHNNGGGGGTASSKVERYALKIVMLHERINELEKRVCTVDKAERVLNRKERDVIDLVKRYRDKLTKIAEILGKEKSYVQAKRDTAIKKMSEYMKGK